VHAFCGCLLPCVSFEVVCLHSVQGVRSVASMGLKFVGSVILAGYWFARYGVSASCVGNISSLTYAALESLYSSTAGWDWSWDPSQPNSTIWHFPCNLSTPCSSAWQGITCVSSTDENETICEINEIYLCSYNLKGTLPTEIGSLVNMQYLYLNDNSLYDGIPSEVGALTNLLELQIEDNLLEGAIPSELGNLVNVQHFYLDQNSLTGALPPELSNLVSVSNIYLNGNSLSGPIPSEFGHLENLEVLNLYVNCLDGTLPAELGQLSNVVDLWLYSNSISGTIPTELGQMLSSVYFYLNQNSLTGGIPSELSNFMEMRALFLNDNCLDGTIPTELGQLSNLFDLWLYANCLSGSIPAVLGNLSSLQELELDANLLEGTIPSELGNLVTLDYLFLYQNSLTGTIPTELGNLLILQGLQLQANLLEGTIPTELGKIPDYFATLYLYHNLLTGDIPTEVGLLSMLEALFVYENSLVGAIPSEMGNLVDLVSLNLDSNSLSGLIPSELCGLTNLVTLALSDNSLSGTIPFVMNEWPALQSLNLSTNRLTGSIDAFRYLNGSLRQLLVLDISNNQFSGNLSDSVFLLPSIQTVILSQNCFHGTLPTSICASTSLTNVVLDLLTANCGDAIHGFRGFVLRHYVLGTIPSCIWNSSSIQVLHLLGNGLVGSLSDLSNDSSLTVVGLGSNQLAGTIPISFQRRSFTQLDLSINRLSGTLDSDLLINTTSTTVYDLSANRLSGGIPVALYAAFSPGTINVLDGNLFGCQQSSIPSSDANHDTYQCGSFDLQYSLLIWIVCASAVVSSFVIMTSIGGVVASRYISIAKSRIFLGILYGPLSCMGVSFAALFVFVTVKLAETNVALSTHNVQYWWTATVVYLHDGFICVVVIVLLSVLASIFTIAIMSLARQEKRAAVQPAEGTYASKTADFGRQAVAHGVNISVVTLVNAVYILIAVENLNGYALLALQAALGIFKLAWCSVTVPVLISRSVANASQRLPHWMFMVLYVFLGAPFMSSFCESSSCFLYVLTLPSQIVFTYAIESVSVVEECTPNCSFSIVKSYQAVQSSVMSPWMYSYQCSSAVIVSYAPVLILSYLVSGILIPFGIVAWNYSPRLSALAKKLFPCMLYDITFAMSAPEDRTQQERQSSSISSRASEWVLSTLSTMRSISSLGRKMVIKYILNLAVMLTFGLAVPLLNIAVLFDTAFSLGTILVLIQSSTEVDDSSNLDSAKARQEFWDSFDLPADAVSGCCYIVLGYVSLFWSLFVFDWIGDVYGSLSGGLAMLVPLMLPSLVGYGLLRTKQLRERLDNARKTSIAIELGGGINPLILPQNTNDNFERSM
jgi:Leucine-rich repeat (LRR) protein